MPTNQILIDAAGIEKSYPGVKALKGVDFQMRRGEIHALMGENGAGKSTLIKILTGLEQPQAGTIVVDGRSVAFVGVADAEGCGISTVYQEVNLIPTLSVAENLLMGRQPTRFGFIRWREMYRRAEKALERLGIKINVRLPLEIYSTAIQQMVAIARARDINA